MFNKFSQSWELVKASASVLSSDKELLWLPVISAIAAVIVAITFFLPSWALGMFAGGGNSQISWAIAGFLFYLTQYSVIFFFNTALVGAAMIRLEGGDPTVMDGIRIARERIGAIFGYAMIAAVVGVILKSLQERAGWLGRIVIGLIGAGWTIASFLVVPVLVAHNLGPVDALKESVRLVKKSWGENLIGNVGIGLAFGLLSFAVIIAGVGLTALGFWASPWIGVSIAVIFVLAVIILAVIQAALTGIYSAALYRFAVDGQAPNGFDGAMMQAAFAHK